MESLRRRGRGKSGSDWGQVGSMIARGLITFGIVLILAGLLWPVLQKIGLGRLPGDIVIERQNFRFYFPLGTSIVISVVLTALYWLLHR